MENPRYAMLVMLDEAQADRAQATREAGWNVAVVSGQIIRRIAPMLGVLPSTAAGIDDRLMRIGARP